MWLAVVQQQLEEKRGPNEFGRGKIRKRIITVRYCLLERRNVFGAGVLYPQVFFSEKFT
jgi:hypothetical protein